MSQVSKAIYANALRNREGKQSLFGELARVSSGFSDHTKDQVTYTVGLNIQTRVHITYEPNGLLGDTGHLMLKHAKESIVESIFGEFREDIIKIRLAIMANDGDKALELLTQLQYSMFKGEE